MPRGRHARRLAAAPVQRSVVVALRFHDFEWKTGSNASLCGRELVRVPVTVDERPPRVAQLLVWRHDRCGQTDLAAHARQFSAPAPAALIETPPARAFENRAAVRPYDPGSPSRSGSISTPRTTSSGTATARAGNSRLRQISSQPYDCGRPAPCCLLIRN